MARYFIIDITSEVSYPIKIGRQWCIKTPPPSTVLGVIKPHIEKKVCLKIGMNKKGQADNAEQFMVDNRLKVDKNRLFSIIYDGQEEYLSESSKIDIKLAHDKTFFQLFLNPSAIHDCIPDSTSPSDVYQIVLPLYLTNEDGVKIDRKTEVINIKFSEVHTKPEAKVVINEEWKSFLFKRNLGEKEIGKVIISNPAPLKYFPSIDFEAKLNVTLNGKIVDSDFVRLDFTTVFNDKIKKNDEVASAFSVEDFKSTVLQNDTGHPIEKEIEIPIVVDIQRLGNPYEPEGRTYQLDLETTYQHHGEENTQVMKETNSFTIMKDDRKAELHVLSDNEEIPNGGKHIFPEKEFIYDCNSLNISFPLTIKNAADNGNPRSGIIIGDFTYDVSFEEDNVIEIYDNAKTRKDVFHFSDADGKNLFNGITNDNYYQIDSEPGSDLNLLFGFSGKDIKRLCRTFNEKTKYEVTLLIKFFFNYWLNDNGLEEEAAKCSTVKEFSATLCVTLKQAPCSEWLGIDFGTSAIVSMFDSDLLDLRDQKTKLFKGKDLHYENGTKFLSSNIVFRTNAKEWKNSNGDSYQASQLLSESRDGMIPDFHSLAVCLSPTWEEEGRNYRFVLPCLKLMVGYEILPQLESFPNDQFTYFTGNMAERKSNKLIDENNLPTILAKVDTIIDEVYRELFQYYIRESLPKNIPNEKINRLVLTIPNTFSPSHKETIRSIVKKSLGHLDIRDICFVSESDAVACYYLKNRRTINDSIGRSLDSINENENILVYDMGAGTLDLSLFRLQPAENGTRKVTVLGKIGLSKAGNYLDYVLATIVAKIVANSAPEIAKKLEAFISCTSVDLLNSARELKSFIKDELKPAIGIKDMVVLEKDKYPNLVLSSDIKLNLKDVVNHQDYKRFIGDCTNILIENFFRFLGFHNPNEFPLDTVVVSGRSSKLQDIRNALEQALEPYKHTNCFRMYYTAEGTNDASKTAVVEGALKYAKELFSKEPIISFIEDSITPCYGVIYKDQNQNEHYIELFDPRKVAPMKQTIQGEDGSKVEVKTYKTDDVVIDLRYTENLLLIQSYSGETEKDWNTGQMDYISVVQTYNKDNLGRLQDAKLRIEVDTQNMLKLVVNNRPSENYSPNRIDLNKSSIGKSLWPRVQKNTNQN